MTSSGVVVICANQLFLFQMFSWHMKVWLSKATALHILVGQQNVVGWLLLFIYLGTPTSHYSLEYNVRTTYMESSGGGGLLCKKVKDIGANNHYYIGGYYSFFLTCYHYGIFYFGLIEKGLSLLIIPN